MFCGLCLPFLLFAKRTNTVGWPALGLAFGGSVVIPWLVICILTLPAGLSRYHEFWRYYEIHYGIGMTGIKVVYVPLAFIGAASVYELFRQGVW